MTLLPLALALALTTDPAAPAKAAPPPPGPARDFKLPAMTRFTLENGLAVTLVQVGPMPKATIQLSVRAGLGDERPDEAGLAKFVAAMLKEGTTTRSATEIAARAARWGGAVDTVVTPDETVVDGTVLSEFAPAMVGLLADVATHPAFPEKELERVRQDQIREVSIARSVPSTLAQERFLAVTYPGSAYGRLLATEAQLQALPREKLLAFHGGRYAARRARLYVAGRFDGKAVEQAVREAFGGWTAGTAPAPAEAQPSSRRVVNLLDRPGAVQSSLYVGLPALDPRSPEYVKLVVTNTLLGGYFSSRMTANLREAKGYTYSPRSVLSVRRGAPGFWAQVADVTTAVTGASLKEIFFEIDRLRGEAPGAAELKAVQSFLAGQYVLQVSTRDGLVDRLRFVDLHGLPPDWLETYVQQVKAVTPADAQAVARKYLDGARMSVVVVGDRKVVEEQVKPFGEIVAGPQG
jgi:zinc protease